MTQVGKMLLYNLKVCHSRCVRSIIQRIMCIYLHIYAVKNTIGQMLSLCNMQHCVIYNYMFRPCKWAIIRVFVEPVRWLNNRSFFWGDDIPPPPNSYCIVTILVLRTIWWWPIYKAETCSCILHSVAFYIVIPSDQLCFWLRIYGSIYTLYAVLLLHSLVYWEDFNRQIHVWFWPWRLLENLQ